MDISVLNLFVEVMQQGNFAAVARDRDIDPSSVSRAIAALEAELGVRLFHRTTRRLSATEAGRTYFEHIEPLLDDLQQAINATTEVSDQPKGTLRVTASVSFGSHCIVPHLPEFQTRFPELAVELLLTDTVLDLVANRIDVAVRLGILPDSTLIARRLIPTHYSVCASPDYLRQVSPLKTPEDITHHNCLLFPLANFRTRWLFKDQQGQLGEVPVTGKTVISNAIALKECTLSGMGLALLPNWLIQSELQANTLINVFPNHEVTATTFNTAAWLVYPSRSYVPLKARVFMDFLLGTLSNEPSSLDSNTNKQVGGNRKHLPISSN